jgi:LmbE family N-acetylglucosaminyl deacetylase
VLPDELAILAPHFDDAVLSCGGQMWDMWQRGHSVRVITLFAGPPPADLPPFARVQHRMWGDPPDANVLRRAEDTVACARLGCFDLHHLEFPDAVYRLGSTGEPLYGSEEAIFGQIHPEEHDFVTGLARVVRRYLPQDATVLAPLGMGNHVDHQLAFTVGQSLLGEGWRVKFYEELPYVDWPGVVEHTRAARQRQGLRARSIPISAEALAARVEAMAYYRTQIPVLYGDELNMRERLHAVASAGAGQYVERLWIPEGRGKGG